MAYHFSSTPKPPVNGGACTANIGNAVGAHEPLELHGSDFDHLGSYTRCDDGGLVMVSPCRLCGLMYYRSLNLEKHILYQIKRFYDLAPAADPRPDRRQVNERALKHLIMGHRGELVNNKDGFTSTVNRLVESEAILRVELEDGTIAYTWNGDDHERI